MAAMDQLRFRLYHYWRSSSSWRVRWAMAIKNIPCEFVSVNLLSDEPESPEHLQRNPMGYVPVLEILEQSNSSQDAAAGLPQYLAESTAIIELFEELIPSPSLFPGDAFARAKIRQLTQIMNAGTQPLQNPNVAQWHSSEPAEQKKWNQHWIRKGLEAYEILAQNTAGTFSVGDTITSADLTLIPQCYNAGRNDVDLAQFPTLARIYQNALQTESCKASAPDRFAP